MFGCARALESTIQESCRDQIVKVSLYLDQIGPSSGGARAPAFYFPRQRNSPIELTELTELTGLTGLTELTVLTEHLFKHRLTTNNEIH